jgi:hypothetical protein
MKGGESLVPVHVCPASFAALSAHSLVSTELDVCKGEADKHKAYLVPVNNAPAAKAMLRLTAPKNGQEKNVRWAKEYEL